MKGKLLAEGNAEVEVAGGLLFADHMEYTFATKTLVATGAVRFTRGAHYVQASSFRYDFVRQEGELKDTYGTISFDTLAEDLDFRSPADGLKALPEVVAAEQRQDHQQEPEPAQRLPVACPLLVPMDDAEAPDLWAVSLWGGSQALATPGESLTFRGEALPGGLIGLGAQRRLLTAGQIEVLLDLNLMRYGAQLLGNRLRPESSGRTADVFTDATAGIGLRSWLHPHFSLAAITGISWRNETFNSHQDFPAQTAQSLRQYYGLEAELALAQRWSVLGRIQHRPGSDRHSGSRESSSYLAGVRYRFGGSQRSRPQRNYQPPGDCPNPDRGHHALQPLDDLLHLVAFSSFSSQPEVAKNPLPEGKHTRQPLPGAVEQRVSEVKAKQGLQLVQLKRRIGGDELVTTPDSDRDPAIPLPLQQLEDSSVKLLDGQISRWRFQARSLKIAPEVLTSPRIALTNDPLTPAQLIIEGVRTKIVERSDGEVEIISATHRGLLDGKLPVPIPNRILLRENRENRFKWSLLDDQENRDGLYIQRTLDARPFLGGQLTIKPQFMLNRALSGSTGAYPPSHLSLGDDPVERSTAAADLLGLDMHYARPVGPQGEGQLSLQADLSTLVPDHFAEAARSEMKIEHPLSIPGIGDVMGNISAAYRFSVWNGSLSHQDVYTAFGGFLEQTRHLGRWGPLENQLFWRLGAQNINATIVDTTDLSGKTWRASGYVRLTSTLQAWEAKGLEDPQAALRYSRIPVHPGLRITFNSIGRSIRYGDGNGQNTYTFSMVPTLTLGRFSRSYLDYSQLSIGGSVSVVDRLSPYAFDRAVDLGILHASLKQQIVGPLVLSLDLSYNIDKGSENYGQRVDSLLQLQWQRRAYELSAFYAPERKFGGLQIRLNDFDWRGNGIPFMPYTPLSWPAGAK